MKEFVSLVRKECRHIFRDKRTVLIVMIMPMIQIVLFGFAVSTEVTRVRVAFCGDIFDMQARTVMERIENNSYLEYAGLLSGPEAIEALFRRNGADAVVCFSRDFGRSAQSPDGAAIRIVGDGSDPNTARIITSYVAGVIQQEQQDVSVAVSGERRPSMSPVVQLMYNPAMKSSYNFVPGVMGLILMLICSMMTAVSIVREKETGTLELLLVSPVRPLWIIMSKLMPYLLLSVLNFASILLLSHYVMEVPIRGSLALLALVATVFVAASLAMGILVSVVSSSQRTAMLVCGMGLTMPTMIFSGIIFPCENMPLVLRWFSDIIPAKWFIIMVKKIMIQGAGFASVAGELAILSGMAAVLLAVSIRSFRTRLQ